MSPGRSFRPARGPLGLALAAALLFVVALGCGKPENTPERVADSFVEAYFRRMDQQSAKEFTALGATKMLEAELKSVQDVRKEGYEPGSVDVAVHRGDPIPREDRIRIPYEIEIQTQGGKQVRDADIELTRIDGLWKVVRVGVTHRDTPKPQ